MSWFNSSPRYWFYVIFFTSVLVFLAFYFDVGSVQLKLGGQKTSTWTGADVLNNTNLPDVLNGTSFLGALNNSSFKDASSSTTFTDQLNNAELRKDLTNTKFQDVGNNTKLRKALTKRNFQDVLDNSKFPRPNLLPCDWKPEAWNKVTRSLCFLACGTTSDDGVHRNISSSTLVCKQVEDHADRQFISSLSPEEAPCLKYFINQHCYGKGHKIPRVAHYVRFGAYELTLEAFFGMYSAARFLQPCLILFHGDTIPSGPYWRMLLHLVPNIVHVQTNRPREIFGRKIDVIQHSSDVARMTILLEYGGIYADFDELLLHSFDDLLDKDTVLGLETQHLSINNALILAKPDSKFLQIWLSKYTTFDDKVWADHSTRLPYRLSQQYPHLVHVVDSFYPPLTQDQRVLYEQKTAPHFNWATQHGLHLYLRTNLEFIRSKGRLDKQNNLVGDVIRYILHGKKTACMKP